MSILQYPMPKELTLCPILHSKRMGECVRDGLLDDVIYDMSDVDTGVSIIVVH